MAIGEQSDSGGRGDGRVLLATMAGAAIGAALSLLLGSVVDFHGFGVLVFVAGIVVGIVLGRLAGSRLFGRPRGLGQ